MKKLLVVLLMASMVLSATDAAFARPRGSGGRLSQTTRRMPQTKIISEAEGTVIKGGQVPMIDPDGKQTLGTDQSTYADDIFNGITLDSNGGSAQVGFDGSASDVTGFVVEVDYPNYVGRIEYEKDENGFKPVAYYVYEVSDGVRGEELGGGKLAEDEGGKGSRGGKFAAEMMSDIYQEGIFTLGHDKHARFISYDYMDFVTVPGNPAPITDPTDPEPVTPIDLTPIVDPGTPLAELPEIVDEPVPLWDGTGDWMIPLGSLPLTGEGNLIALLCLGLAVSVTTMGASAMALRRRYNA